MPPPPPYTSNSGEKTRISSSFRLAVPNLDRITEKRKSEIRSLLEATEARGDDHKPEWMYSHIHPPAVDSHGHNRHQQGGNGHDNAGYETEDEAESKALPWPREDEAVHQQPTALSPACGLKTSTP